MTKEYVELYVSSKIRSEIETKAQDLKGVNRRIYINKLLFIVSRLHAQQINKPKDFAKHGVRLRIYVNAKVYKENPAAKLGTLGWLFSNPQEASNMVQTLIVWGIIKMNGHSKIGQCARSYMFTERFMDCPPKLEKFNLDTDGAFLPRFVEYKTMQQDNPLNKSILLTYVNNVSVSEEGLKYIENNYAEAPSILKIVAAYRNNTFDANKEELLKHFSWQHIKNEHRSLIQFILKEFRASIGPRNGRISHNLTELQRQYRKFILLNGKPLLETDISNCQPALAVALIKSYLKATSVCKLEHEDLKLYETMCAQGVFYEEVASRAGIVLYNEDRRNQFKEALYSQVFYCRNNNWGTPIQTAFKELFPTADKVIREMKKKNYREFALRCQQLESDVMIKIVYKKLIEEGHIVLPLHDAIYCGDEGTKVYAQTLIRSTLRAKYDLEISFKEERKTAQTQAKFGNAKESPRNLTDRCKVVEIFPRSNPSPDIRAA